MQILSPFLECSIAITTKQDGPITEANQLQALFGKHVTLPIHEHGTTSHIITAKDNVADIKADILLTREKDYILAHQFADCVPLLFVDRRKKAITFAHAGWKGVVSGIVPISILTTQLEHRSDPADLWVWIGPCIRSTSYVMPTLPAQINIMGWEKFIVEKEGWYHVDLPGFIESQCMNHGIDSTRIIIDGRDSYCEADLFSHQRFLQTKDVHDSGNFAVCAWLTQ